MPETASTEESTVIFLHIPKTAGTTLHRIIERQYRSRQIFTVGRHSQESIEEFKRTEESRRAEYRLVKGHVPFGFHELVHIPWTYFTVLRDPIERVISFHSWVRRTPHHYHFDFITLGDMSLKEYVESRSNVLMDNGQVRMISGAWYDLGFGGCTEDVLETAKRHLREHFAVVGLTDRFDETLILLCRAFGWRNPFYVRENVSTKRPRKDQLPTDTLDAITRANQLDFKLYQYAAELFEESIGRMGPSFSEELDRFRSVNRLMSPLVYVQWEIRKYSLRMFVRRWLERLAH